MKQRIDLRVLAGFRFSSVVRSHGWCSLLPFSVTNNPLVLIRDIALSRRTIVRVTLSDVGTSHPDVLADSLSPLSDHAIGILIRRILECLNVDQDITPFYKAIRHIPRFAWAESAGAGRMLRGETFFENTVKTILTTNCSWALTTAMNRNLLEQFGIRNRNGWTAFPTAEAIAESTPDFLRKTCKLGYRAPSVHELATRCAQGTLDIETFRTSHAPSAELFEALLQIRGIGPYAAANLLRMLGRFDYLGLDSWCRKKINELHGNGVALSDAQMENIYAPYQEWRGLAMWLDVTRHWYDDKFPLTK